MAATVAAGGAPLSGGVAAITRLTPATLAVTTLIWADATIGYLPPGMYAPTLLTGMFLCPRRTPGMVSISMSVSALLCAWANVRICFWANSISRITVLGT